MVIQSFSNATATASARRRTLVTAIGVTLAAGMMIAKADEPQDPSGRLEEVIVTALKRNQPLQETPVSVTAFTSDQLSRQNITRPIDFIGSTPNMIAVEANHPGDLRITIRGETQVLNTDPPVAVVFDGAVLTGATGLNRDLLDIDQIEILKGPQGSLYGRNAIAGAVNITSRAPTDTFEGAASAGYGNGETSHAQLRLSGPLVDGVLRASMAVGTRDSAGFYTNSTTGQKVMPYHEDAARVRLDWLVHEGLKAQLNLSESKIRGGATEYTSQSLIPSLQTAGAISGTVDANFAGAPYVHSVGNWTHVKDVLHSLKVEQSTPYGTLSSVTAYELENDIFASAAFPYVQGGNSYQYNQHANESWSEELRFTSPSEGRLRYIGGVDLTHISQTPFLLAATGTTVSGIPPQFPQPLSGNVAGNTTATFSSDNIYADAYAAYLNVDYSLTNVLDLTVAGRYDHEKKHAEDVAGAAYSATSGAVRYGDYSKFQPKIGLQWKIQPDINAYASYAEGFKPGGFNAAQAFELTGGIAPNQYPGEVAKNAEVGIKTEWFNKRLVVNAAAFYTKKDNSQLFQFLPAASLDAVTVIDKINVKGGELEIVAVPTRGLNIRAGLGYSDAKIDQLVQNPEYVGNHAPYVPDFTATITPSYTWQLTKARSFELSATYDHWGKTYFDTANSPQAVRDGLNFLSARFNASFGNWSLGVWGKNLTDVRYNADVVVVLNNPAIFTQALFVGPPRTFGADVNVKW